MIDPQQQTITLYGKKMIAGLSWQASYPANLLAIQKRKGALAGFKSYVAHSIDNMVQLGLTNEVTRANSLALALVKAVAKKNWIGVFKLPNNNYALVAVHNYLIMPGCDLIGSQQQIETLLQQTIQLVEQAGESWQAIYAPTEFVIGGEEKTLQQLFPGKVLPTKLALSLLNQGISPQLMKILIATGFVE